MNPRPPDLTPPRPSPLTAAARAALAAVAGIALSVAAAAPARAQGAAACRSDAFQARCLAGKEIYRSTCAAPPAIELPPDAPAVVERTVGRLERVEEAAKVWIDLNREYPACDTGTCDVTGHEYRACAGLPAAMKGAWARFDKDVVEAAMRRVDELAAEGRRQPMSPFLQPELALIAQRLTTARDLARFAFLGIDAAAFDRYLARIAATRAEIVAAKEKALAGIKCPAATRKDAALTKALREVLEAHGRSLHDPSAGLTETLARFGLTGTSRTVREAWARITHEDAPGVACVLQVRHGDTTCRILEYTFRRSRPDGGGWGRWSVHSVGGGREMGCKNLR